MAGARGRKRKQRPGVRIILSSTRFVASFFWLTIVVATMLFVLPYSDRTQSPAFYIFVALGIMVFLAHRYFPYEGYHPLAFFLLLLSTDVLVAVMVYLAGGSSSSVSLLYLMVIIFSSAYFELKETLLLTAFTCAIYFAPVAYEDVAFEALKNMAIAVPIYFLIALCGFFVINKAREQEKEKQALTRLYDQADLKTRELSTLYAASLKFASTLDEMEILAVLQENARELVKSDALAIALVDAPGSLRVREYEGLREEDVAMIEEGGENNPVSVSASAVLPVILKENEKDARFASFLEKTGYRSMIAVPLYASASVIGVLACYSRLPDAFDDEAARVLLTLSSEAALAQEKARLYQTTLDDKTKIEAIINSLTDGLAVIDAQASLVLANPSVSNFLDLRPEDYGNNFPRLIERCGDGAEFKEASLEEALELVLKRGESCKNEMIVGSNPRTVFQVFWVPLQDAAGKVAGAVILLHDITDFVELDRMKSDFISLVSHELKTPLTLIKGFVRLLAAERLGPITEKQQYYLEIVQNQTDSLTALINDLLDLSKIESGIIEIRREAVSLAEVVERVWQQLEGLAAEKEISLEVEVPPDFPPVSGDAGRLGQVFMNLIHNAVKFTPPRGKVWIKAGVLGDACLVRVIDTGIGISQQDLPKVFDKFYQVDSSATRQQGGSGLGLSISRQMVVAQGGDMWVESTKGEGTTFSFTIPFHDPQHGRGAGEAHGLGEAATY